MRPVFDAIPVLGAPIEQIVKRSLEFAYALYGGLYRDDLEFFAEAAGMPPSDVLVANISYELLALVETSPFACTSGVATHIDGGPVVTRAMDWHLDGLLGQASTWFEFRQGSRRHVTLGVPGLVGALQGQVPGRWACCLNYAPAGELPWFSFSPLMLLRHALEVCDTFSEALVMLRDTPLSAPTFYILAGTEPDQACVIERRRDEAGVVRPLSGVVAIANEHVLARFKHWNDPDYEEDSVVRRVALETSLSQLPRDADMKACLRALRRRPLTNKRTEQRLALQAATGAHGASVRTAMASRR